MVFFGARYERAGQTLKTAAFHAADEAEAMAFARANLPDVDPQGIEIHLGRLTRIGNSYQLVCSDEALEF